VTSLPFLLRLSSETLDCLKTKTLINWIYWTQTEGQAFLLAEGYVQQCVFSQCAPLLMCCNELTPTFFTLTAPGRAPSQLARCPLSSEALSPRFQRCVLKIPAKQTHHADAYTNHHNRSCVRENTCCRCGRAFPTVSCAPTTDVVLTTSVRASRAMEGTSVNRPSRPPPARPTILPSFSYVPLIAHSASSGRWHHHMCEIL
jgi:hypothetical protein